MNKNLRRTLATIGLALAVSCVHTTPAPTPIAPAPPFSEAVTVIVSSGAMPAGVAVTVSFTTDGGLGPFTTATPVNGRFGVPMPGTVPRPNGGTLVITAPGYVTWRGRGTTNLNGELCPCIPDGGAPTAVVQLQLAAAPFTPTQVRDLQGDLMLWVPSLALSCGPDGLDHRAMMRCASSTGQVPQGLAAGWVWTLELPRFTNPADRAAIYQAAQAFGYTHVAIDADAAACPPGDGYHGLMPTTADDCATYGARITQVAAELHAHHLLVLCADITVDAPFAPGFDGRTLCDAGLDDWDNYNAADCPIDAMATQFAPTTPLYWEQPSGGLVHPDAQWNTDGTLACGTVEPTDTNGGAWIRSVQERVPNFVGVFYETDFGDPAATLALLATRHAWWRDAQEVNGESNTYNKFWTDLALATATAYDAALMAGAPALHGYMSGGPSHPVVVTPTTAGHFLGTLTGADVAMVDGFDFRMFAPTATITQVTISATGLGVVFAQQASWPNFTEPSGLGPLQYSLGIAEQIDGVWYANAPIELWQGLAESGGPIQQPGQIPTNWFYAPRWGAMNGHQPQPGETIGVFVVAGDARNSYFSIPERSNIVLVPLPAPGAVGTFTP